MYMNDEQHELHWRRPIQQQQQQQHHRSLLQPQSKTQSRKFNSRKASNLTQDNTSLGSLSNSSATSVSASATSACSRSRSNGNNTINKNHVNDIVDSTTNSGEDNAYEYTGIVVRRKTPILFSTNRGLHLRVAKPGGTLPTATTTTHCSVSSQNHCHLRTASSYDIQFCDLERWNTRANAVSLEDTFTVSKPQSIFQRSLLSQQQHAMDAV